MTRQTTDFSKFRNPKRIEYLVGTIIKTLVAHGMVVQHYKAYSTKSQYIKVDCGLMNSIRIADHPGKSGLSYMYNIDYKQRETHKSTTNTFKRYYFRPDFVLDMLRMINDRRLDQCVIPALYKPRIIANYHKNKDAKGFWSEAYFYSKKNQDEVDQLPGEVLSL